MFIWPPWVNLAPTLAITLLLWLCVYSWTYFFIKKFQQHLDDKHLSRFLEADGIMVGANQNDSQSSAGAPK